VGDQGALATYQTFEAMAVYTSMAFLYSGGNVRKFIKRLIKEKADLEIKRNKLNTFLGSERFAQLKRPERILMRQQYKVMTEYQGILGERLKCVK
jgi:hypothetical protein